jgi:DNA helicase HerA-like ATPase
MLIGTFDSHTKLEESYSLPDRHTFVCGASGMGKTVLLENIAIQRMRRGEGFGVVDPHGDLIAELLNHIPRHRTEDVIYFDPQHIFGINPLDFRQGNRELAVADTVSAISDTAGMMWGPRLENILTHACYAIVELFKKPNLLLVHHFLSDTGWRRQQWGKMRDGPVKDYFRIYDTEWDKRYRMDATGAVMNKIDRFVLKSLLKEVVGTPGLDFRKAIDRRPILLVKIPKGELGEDVTTILGSFLISKIKFAALSRADTPEERRVPFYLLVDEIQNFLGGVDFPTILSEARKYRLGLTVATQSISSLDPKIQRAIFSNCQNIISFKVSGEDAEIIKKEFGREVTQEMITDLPPFTAYVRSPEDPNIRRVQMLQPLIPHGRLQRPEKVIRCSEDRYGVARGVSPEKGETAAT